MYDPDIGNYEFDELVNDYLFNIFPDIKYDKILEIANIIHNLNHLPNLNIDLDLNQLESELETIITENEQDSNDAIGDMLYSKIISTFIDYLEELGVIVSSDATLSQIEDIFRCLITIYTLDTSIMEEMLSLITNKDRDDVEIFIDIIDDYSNLSTSQLLTIIEDVTQDTLSRLEEYYQLQIGMNNPNLDIKEKNDLEYLIKSNPMFINTKIVKDILEGKTYDNITDVKSMLYKTLEELENNTTLIPYEIIACLYITNTEKIELTQMYKEEIDLSLVSWIGDIQDKHTIIDKLVASVITDLTFRR